MGACVRVLFVSCLRVALGSLEHSANCVETWKQGSISNVGSPPSFSIAYYLLTTAIDIVCFFVYLVWSRLVYCEGWKDGWTEFCIVQLC